jgi:hypothetical protein
MKLIAAVASIRGSKTLRRIPALAGLEVEVLVNGEEKDEEAISCFFQKVALFLELAPGTQPELDVVALLNGQTIVWAETQATPEKVIAGLRSVDIQVVLVPPPVRSSVGRLGEDGPDAVDPDSLRREFGGPGDATA